MVNMNPDISVELYKNLYCLGCNTSSEGTQKILQKKPILFKIRNVRNLTVLGSPVQQYDRKKSRCPMLF